MNRKLALALAPLAILAAGCGGGGGGSSEKKAPAQQPTGGGKGTSVSLKDIQFQPKSLSVKKGATVTWTNDDSVNHDVTKNSGPGPNFKSGSGNLAQGDSYKHTFTAAGTYKLVCTVHPGMEQTVTVK